MLDRDRPARPAGDGDGAAFRLDQPRRRAVRLGLRDADAERESAPRHLARSQYPPVADQEPRRLPRPARPAGRNGRHRQAQRRRPATGWRRTPPSRISPRLAATGGREPGHPDPRRRRRAGRHPQRSRVAYPPSTVTVADTIGAGDTFSAAMLARLEARPASSPRARLRRSTEADLTDLLAYAAKAAAITASRPGADPPWLHEMA